MSIDCIATAEDIAAGIRWPEEVLSGNDMAMIGDFFNTPEVFALSSSGYWFERFWLLSDFSIGLNLSIGNQRTPNIIERCLKAIMRLLIRILFFCLGFPLYVVYHIWKFISGSNSDSLQNTSPIHIALLNMFCLIPLHKSVRINGEGFLFYGPHELPGPRLHSLAVAALKAELQRRPQISNRITFVGNIGTWKVSMKTNNDGGFALHGQREFTPADLENESV